MEYVPDYFLIQEGGRFSPSLAGVSLVGFATPKLAGWSHFGLLSYPTLLSSSFQRFLDLTLRVPLPIRFIGLIPIATDPLVV